MEKVHEAQAAHRAMVALSKTGHSVQHFKIYNGGHDFYWCTRCKLVYYLYPEWRYVINEFNSIEEAETKIIMRQYSGHKHVGDLINCKDMVIKYIIE